MKAPRLTELDALRGIAALGVMLFHFTSAYPYLYSLGRFGKGFTLHCYPSFSFGLGRCGVHLFFIISGFVIFMTLEKTKRPMDFIISRFSRLYPAYWTVLFINLFLVIGKIHPSQFLVNSTMLSAWFNTPYVMQVAWTLTVELSFYICMFLLFSLKMLKFIEPIGLGWLSLMMLDIRLGTCFGFHMPWVLQQSKLLLYGNLFFAGIIFYKIKTEGITWQRNASLGLCWLAQFLVAREYYPTPEAVLAFFVIFYLFCFNKLSFLKSRFFVFLGTISYSLYLVHENFGDMILRALDRPHSSYLINLGVAVACCLSLAYIITAAVEQPALKWIRSIYKQGRPMPVKPINPPVLKPLYTKSIQVEETVV